ncbi:MAG: hypothetical protein GWN10_14315, partial [Nitrospinaceae bacterium]|nr:hypothetical protein [Nitrospinaceae bacterium]NIS86222.1 hypothetical protein [Nitrospinaceae bacterium]NIU97433.1 hypothetical protein [Nitrospinaceae bacterium]NIW60005.1 hypothetical protein [Nitrospinaceae bacterium]NIX35417.1 hypothetical protein [Nitrospinaceae bacterium]
MGYAFLWLEAMAAALVFVALVFALTARFKNGLPCGRVLPLSFLFCWRAGQRRSPDTFITKTFIRSGC